MNFQNFSSCLICLVLFTAVSCSKVDDKTNNTDGPTPNILLIIADDLGKDAISGYAEGTLKPVTPHIDAIRNKGLMFTNFWVNPTCTPTRSSIITGKYGYRTGVKGVGDELSMTETTLQKFISDKTNNKYASAVIGKWHLSGNNLNANPESFGIDYYAGLIRGAVDNYYMWQLTEDGTSSLQKRYTTEVFTDLAINWVNSQSKPWFMWLAYNAPHTPFHVPPVNMHSQGNLPEYQEGMDAGPYYLAAIEAMDFQIGRLLANIPAAELENTVLIFLGDNGTVDQVAQSPYSSNKVKGTLYQGGINVPLFISGKNVSRSGKVENLLVSTDLFATISELAGVTIPQYHDSNSFKKLFSENATVRNYQYSEIKDGESESWAISDGNYKLIVHGSRHKEMYLLSSDPYESNNLLDGMITLDVFFNKEFLEGELVRIRN